MPSGARDPDPIQLARLLDAAARADASEQDVRAAKDHVDEVFAAHWDAINRVCLRYVRDPIRASELTQETMLTAWRKLGEWQGRGSFYSWLYGIARFKCLRANAKRQDLLTSDGILEPASPEATALAQLREDERNEVLAAATALLDPIEREALHLRYECGLPVERISEILALEQASGARGLLQRCRRKLRRQLAQELVGRGHGTSLLFGSIGD